VATLASAIRQFTEKLGRTTVNGIVEFGYSITLFLESFYWLVFGYRRNQAVKVDSLFAQMMQIGIAAIPIVFVLSFVIGIMLAIQGIATLKTFGAESQVVLGIALSVTREFSPLIIGILVAGRSGSALAARIGTMTISQEIDALRVIGVSPVRYLVTPALVAMMIMLPTLTFFGDLVALLGGAIYSNLELGLSLTAYADRSLEILTVDDVMQGIWKSLVFAVIIVLVSFSNGFSVTAGAEGVGKATTRSVVLSITYIIIADMIFTFILTH